MKLLSPTDVAVCALAGACGAALGLFVIVVARWKGWAR